MKTNFGLYIWPRIWEENCKNYISSYILSGQTRPTMEQADKGVEQNRIDYYMGSSPFSPDAHTPFGQALCALWSDVQFMGTLFLY